MTRLEKFAYEHAKHSHAFPYTYNGVFDAEREAFIAGFKKARELALSKFGDGNAYSILDVLNNLGEEDADD